MGTDKKSLSAGNKPGVVILNSSEQTREIREAVACRAYELFANRGSAGGHELEDWRQAEAELAKPLSCGLMLLEENLWVGTGVAPFEADSIEIWVAARKITICGKPSSSRVNAGEGEHRTQKIIFRVLDLPVEIDPSGTTVKLRGRSIEILLKKAKTEPKQKVKAAA